MSFRYIRDGVSSKQASKKTDFIVDLIYDGAHYKAHPNKDQIIDSYTYSYNNVLSLYLLALAGMYIS